MPTIPKNHTRKIAAIKDKDLVCRAYTRSNQYKGVVIDVAWAWQELYKYGFAKLSTHSRGGWVIHLHGECWYRLTEKEK